MYLSLTDISYNDQLSAAAFIFNSGYKLISCCFYLLRDPLSMLSVYWQVYLQPAMKRDGHVKRPANRNELFTHLNFSNFANESCAWILSTPLNRKRIFNPDIFLMTFVGWYRMQTPPQSPDGVFRTHFEFSSAMFEITTVVRRAFWVKKCDGFASKVIRITSWGNKSDLSLRIQCVKVEF